MTAARTGYLSELVAQRRVAELGAGVLVPQGPAVAFDFVAHIHGSFSRIQVKTARFDKTGLNFNTITGQGGNRRALTPSDTDIILVVDPSSECYVVLPNGKQGGSLRGTARDDAVLKSVSQLFVNNSRLPAKLPKGVSWSSRLERWVVCIAANGKKHYDGSYADYNEALLAAENKRAEVEGIATCATPQLLRDAALLDS